MKITRTPYFRGVINSFDWVLKDAVSAIIDSKLEFDSIAGTGLSGALIVPALGRALDVPWALIRKEGESTHDNNVIVGTVTSRWIFVDDFIDYGDTFRRVNNAIIDIGKKENSWNETVFHEKPEPLPECVGAYLYNLNKVLVVKEIDSILNKEKV